jgi:hypothetical protein
LSPPLLPRRVSSEGGWRGLRACSTWPVAVLGGWAHGYVRAQVYVPGDATATAQNVAECASLVRYGFVADLMQATLMLFVVLALYQLLRHVNRDVARAMVIFVVVSVAITCLNLVTQFGAVLVASDVV